MKIEVDFVDCIKAYINEKKKSWRGIILSDVEGPISALLVAITSNEAAELILSLINEQPGYQKKYIFDALMEEEAAAVSDRETAKAAAEK